MADLLQIKPGVAIPLSEVELRTSRSGGPGGQHANVTASRVEAVFDVNASQALTEAQRARVAARLGPRVTAAAQDTRSQLRNRELALERLGGRLAPPPAGARPPRATRPRTPAPRSAPPPRPHDRPPRPSGGGLTRRSDGARRSPAGGGRTSTSGPV